MRQLVSDGWKRTAVVAAVLLVIMTDLALILEVMQASFPAALPGLQAATPYPTYPTDYPRQKQTIVSAQRQTQQAGALTPFPTGTIWYFLPSISTSEPMLPPVGTPAGDGVIEGNGEGGYGQLPGMFFLNAWAIDSGGMEVIVFAGVENTDDQQGMVDVVIYAIDGDYQLPDGGFYLTPNRSGPVHIVGAQGQRLILLSAQGETFYFDVPGEQFTTSLTANVPTATLWPVTSVASATPTLNGDARHYPDDVQEYSPINTPLHFILYQAGDEHWFRFQLTVPGTIQVHLTQLPVNYNLYVYSVTRDNHVSHDGQSTNIGTTDELVVIQNAPVDDYMVRVVSVNGAFDRVHSYQLKFDGPVPVRN